MSTEIAEQAAEATAEVVEETVDGVVETLEVVRNNPVALAVVGVLGLAAGAAGGYFVAKKKLKAFYEDLAEQEIAEAKEFYAGVYKTGEDGQPLSPQEVLSQRHPEAAEAVRVYQGRAAAEAIISSGDDIETALDEQDEAQIARIEERRRHEVEEEPDGTLTETVEETRNVFTDPHFDLDEERKHRREDKPYILSHDEYFAGEKDYDTVSLTYYEADDTLTDEQDKPIREIDKTIGEDHLIRFGHGSRDRNIVYVRNDRLETDYEIVKSTGSYVEEVLGMLDQDENSLKHSDQAARRREFRRGE